MEKSIHHGSVFQNQNSVVCKSIYQWQITLIKLLGTHTVEMLHHLTNKQDKCDTIKDESQKCLQSDSIHKMHDGKDRDLGIVYCWCLVKWSCLLHIILTDWVAFSQGAEYERPYMLSCGWIICINILPSI